MIITCPACSKRYLVEEDAIGKPGHQVQCVSCDNSWFFKPIPGAKELNQTHLDLIGVESSVTSDANSIHLGWLLLFITVFMMGVGVFAARQPIMKFWPTSHVIYKMVGLGPKISQEGLRFNNLLPIIEPTKKGQKLLLTGTIINEGNIIHEVSNLRIVVKGDCQWATWWERFLNKYIYRQAADQCRLEKWIYEPFESKIYPGERIAFETSSPRFLKGAKSIQVQF